MAVARQGTATPALCQNDNIIRLKNGRLLTKDPCCLFVFWDVPHNPLYMRREPTGPKPRSEESFHREAQRIADPWKNEGSGMNWACVKIGYPMTHKK